MNQRMASKMLMALNMVADYFQQPIRGFTVRRVSAVRKNFKCRPRQQAGQTAALGKRRNPIPRAPDDQSGNFNLGEQECAILPDNFFVNLSFYPGSFPI